MILIYECEFCSIGVDSNCSEGKSAMKVKIKDNPTQKFWWYASRAGEVFEVDRDKEQPRKFYSLFLNGKHHHIRCCDARIVK